MQKLGSAAKIKSDPQMDGGRRGSNGARQVVASLQDKPGHLIRRLQQLAVDSFESWVAPFAITAPQHIVMTCLYINPGIDQVTLAEFGLYDKMTAGDIVKRLERRGLVCRERSKSDRRSFVLSLTPAGEELLLAMQDAVQRCQEEILAPLSPSEKKQFFKIMRRLVGFEGRSILSERVSNRGNRRHVSMRSGEQR